MNEVSLLSLYLQHLEEERPEQRGVCLDEHNRHFLVLKDSRLLFEHHDQPTKGGYVAAGDAVVVVQAEKTLELSEVPKPKNDEEW